MNRRNFFALLALASLGCSAPISSAASEFTDGGSTKRLRVGQTWRFDEGLQITFLAVRNDSRCPRGVECVWAGDAEVILRVTAGTAKPRKVVLHTTLEPRSIVIPAQPPGTIGIPKSYVIDLRGLTPQPVVGRKIPQAAYRAKLHVSVAQ